MVVADNVGLRANLAVSGEKNGSHVLGTKGGKLFYRIHKNIIDIRELDIKIDIQFRGDVFIAQDHNDYVRLL